MNAAANIEARLISQNTTGSSGACPKLSRPATQGIHGMAVAIGGEVDQVVGLARRERIARAIAQKYNPSWCSTAVTNLKPGSTPRT